MRGYKAFNKDLICRGMQYEIGQTYEFDGEPIPCKQGFHFCKSIVECYNYYPMSNATRICEVSATGDIKTDDEIKYCTNKIQIIREVKTDWEKRGNTNESSGAGFCNSGYCNTGNMNTGHWNTGSRNTGNWNTGNWNMGNWNTGNCNTGNRNSGDCNTGDWNTGNFNTGNWNTGNLNTGNWNTGNCNTGDWNIISYADGCFNTKDKKITMFDKLSDWTMIDWLNSDARRLLNQIPRKVVEWVFSSDMTDEEKTKHNTHETTGGYLKVLDESESAQIWWDGLSEVDRKVIYDIPNFDKEKFEKCVGIKIGQSIE